MKTSSHSYSSKGFTLVELLVVIAIIAVLASATFAIGPTMMNKAKKVSALATATSIAGAVEQFYTEYSALPDTGTNSSDLTIDSEDSAFLNILAGTEPAPSSGSSLQNPKKIRFLTVKDAKNGMDGAVYDATNNITDIFDPWGQPYTIMLDYNYDEQMTVDPAGSAPAVTLNGRRVAVYSLGVRNSGDASASTLVKTW